MSPSDRLVVNTAAQYIRTIVNIFLSMYSMRLVLQLLGESDYGVYSVVAGVVALLSFVSNALVVSTQRFLSYNQGKSDTGRLKLIFDDSVLLHIYIGAALALVLACLTPLLFGGFLDIPSERVPLARIVYYSVIATVVITFITAPYRASLVAHEDIVFISAVDVADGLLKVFLVILLSHISVDSLAGYGVALMLIQLFNLVVLSMFASVRYDECGLPRFHRLSSGYIKDLSSFAGWTVYSTGCIVGRTQGLAIILNRTLGHVSNAAFGIAQSVAGYTHFISESLLNAIRPQIMKAEGEGNRSRMLDLSCRASRLSFLLLTAVVVPLCFYADVLLDLWFEGVVPQGSAFFCRMVLVAGTVDAITIGLGSANQAVGDIRNYSLVVNTTKLMSLPLILWCLHSGAGTGSIAVCYIAVELLCALIRIPFLKKTAGLDAGAYLRSVIVPVLPAVAIYVPLTWFLSAVLSLGMIPGSLMSVCIYSLIVLSVSLDSDERRYLRNMLTRLFRR